MNAWGHFKTITSHKLLVMKYCFKVGLYKQGLLHDLSKYSPTEFLVGAKYYQGTRSPNNAEREATGVSTSWLHHKGRNKHHFEYWVDYGIGAEHVLARYANAKKIHRRDDHGPHQRVTDLSSGNVYRCLAAGIFYEGKRSPVVHPPGYQRTDRISATDAGSEGGEKDSLVYQTCVSEKQRQIRRKWIHLCKPEEKGTYQKVKKEDGRYCSAGEERCRRSFFTENHSAA